MVLNPNAPEWTPGQGSSGEHGEGGGMIAHRAGKRQREGWKKGPELESHAAPGQGDISLGKASTGLTFILT